MMLRSTIARVSRLMRQCRQQSSSPAGGNENRDFGNTPYIAGVRGCDDFRKFGASANPGRRLADFNFGGKAPKCIRSLLRKPDNRYIRTIFEPRPWTRFTGGELERKFHSLYEEENVVSEWYPTDKEDLFISFMKKNGWYPRKVNLRV
jgi:hypothetical protein